MLDFSILLYIILGPVAVYFLLSSMRADKLRIGHFVGVIFFAPYVLLFSIVWLLLTPIEDIKNFFSRKNR